MIKIFILIPGVLFLLQVVEDHELLDDNQERPPSLPV